MDRLIFVKTDWIAPCRSRWPIVLLSRRSRVRLFHKRSGRAVSVYGLNAVFIECVHSEVKRQQRPLFLALTQISAPPRPMSDTHLAAEEYANERAARISPMCAGSLDITRVWVTCVTFGSTKYRTTLCYPKRNWNLMTINRWLRTYSSALQLVVQAKCFALCVCSQK